MTYSILTLIKRRPGTTPAEFRAHYENSHVPLVKKVFGEACPQTYIRYYISRPKESPAGAGEGDADAANADPFPAAMLFGAAMPHFQHDSYTIMTWRDEAHFGRFIALYQEEAGQAIKEDEERFLDKGFLFSVKLDEPGITGGE